MLFRSRESIIIELVIFHAVFCCVGDRDHTVMLIFPPDFASAGASLSGQRFKETAFHDEVEIIEDRHVFRYGVIVIQSSDFRVELD